MREVVPRSIQGQGRAREADPTTCVIPCIQNTAETRYSLGRSPTLGSEQRLEMSALEK